MQFQGAQGQLLLFFGNKAATPLERLLCVVPPVAQFAFQLGPLPPRLDSKKQIQVCCPAFMYWKSEHLSLEDKLCIVSYLHGGQAFDLYAHRYVACTINGARPVTQIQGQKGVAWAQGNVTGFLAA